MQCAGPPSCGYALALINQPPTALWGKPLWQRLREGNSELKSMSLRQQGEGSQSRATVQGTSWSTLTHWQAEEHLVNGWQ